MEFGDRPAISRNLLIGIGIVLGLHVLLFYALISGLATSIVDVVRKPLETKIIAAPPPPPPPPPPPIVPPPPVVTAPPPPFIPPPIIQAQHPPPPVFAQTTTVKPTAPPPKVVTAAPAPKPAVSTSVSAVCRNIGGVASELASEFQQIADQDQVTSASVNVEFTVDAAGNVSGAHVVSSSFPPLNRYAIRAVQQLACRGQGQTVRIVAPFAFQGG